MTSAEDSPPPPSYLAYLQLVRLPNVFTAVADLMMGYLFTHESLEPGLVFAALLLSSSLLYMAGMVLNDVFDVEIDRRERPSRPLPSGRISLSFATRFGYGMMLGGIACGWWASYLAQDLRCGIVAILLAGAVLAYDRIFKSMWCGPLSMGLCRFLNVLLGMSTAIGLEQFEWAPIAWSGVHYLTAAGIGVYIVGITWFARKETELSRPLQLAMATLVAWTGMALLASLWFWHEELEGLRSLGSNPWRWFMVWALLSLNIGWRFGRAVLQPRPKYVKEAVRFGIFSLIVLDTVVCAATRGMDISVFDRTPWPALIFLLLFPTMALGRWIYAT